MIIKNKRTPGSGEHFKKEQFSLYLEAVSRIREKPQITQNIQQNCLAKVCNFIMKRRFK